MFTGDETSWRCEVVAENAVAEGLRGGCWSKVMSSFYTVKDGGFCNVVEKKTCRRLAKAERRSSG